MGSLNPENSSNQDLDDSGCVQDAPVNDPVEVLDLSLTPVIDDKGSAEMLELSTAPVKEIEYEGSAELLDLSDDVLLCILQYCTPIDLKALGHTCSRLGALICDRTLWTYVDARNSPIGMLRLRWLLTHCLSPATKELKIAGYANRTSRCLGIQDLHWPGQADQEFIRGSCIGAAEGLDVEHFLLRMWYPHLPRFAVSPRWPDKVEAESKIAEASTSSRELPTEIIPASCRSCRSSFGFDPKAGPSCEVLEKKDKDSGGNPYQVDDRLAAHQRPVLFEEDIWDECKGPQFTLTTRLMKDLRKTCSGLTSLALEYCNIDYRTTNLRYFPMHLKKLSLRGSKCYNLPLNTSYLGKVQERMPGLEYLDVSECDWFEPASLMPLSKLPALTQLYMRECKRLTECVAYASLATRYGFRKLKVLDLRGSPLADSEVSACGWLPSLEELYVSPPEELNVMSEHTHPWIDTRVEFNELEYWEKEEPEYYKVNPETENEEEDRDEEAEQEKAAESMLNSSWWANSERRIIVIQPNANRQLEAHYPLAQRQPVGGARAEAERPAGPRGHRARPDAAEIPFQAPFGQIDFIMANPDEWLIDPQHGPIIDPRQRPPMRYVDPAYAYAQLAEYAAREPGPVHPRPIPPDPRVQPVPLNLQAGPANPQPGPANPQPGPANPQPGPANPQPGPAKTQSGPANAQPGPAHPRPVPPDPRVEPGPLNLQAGSVNPQPGPGNPHPRPVNPQPGPSYPQPGPANPQPGPAEKPGTSKRRSNGPDAIDLAKRRRFYDNEDVEVVMQSPPPVSPLPPPPAPLPAPLPSSPPPGSHFCPRLRVREFANTPRMTPHTARSQMDAELSRALNMPGVTPVNHNLVSDSALLRLGRAENENVNYVHIGRNGIQHGSDYGSRPDRSNLRILSVTGYRNVTDRSLEHLATSAPYLQHIDFTETGVTPRGVEIFKAVRPDCDVIFSEFDSN